MYFTLKPLRLLDEVRHHDQATDKGAYRQRHMSLGNAGDDGQGGRLYKVVKGTGHD